jgi:hypothetical protein
LSGGRYTDKKNSPSTSLRASKLPNSKFQKIRIEAHIVRTEVRTIRKYFEADFDWIGTKMENIG